MSSHYSLTESSSSSSGNTRRLIFFSFRSNFAFVTLGAFGHLQVGVRTGVMSKVRVPNASSSSLSNSNFNLCTLNGRCWMEIVADALVLTNLDLGTTISSKELNEELRFDIAAKMFDRMIMMIRNSDDEVWTFFSTLYTFSNKEIFHQPISEQENLHQPIREQEKVQGSHL